MLYYSIAVEIFMFEFYSNFMVGSNSFCNFEERKKLQMSRWVPLMLIMDLAKLAVGKIFWVFTSPQMNLERHDTIMTFQIHFELSALVYQAQSAIYVY